MKRKILKTNFPLTLAPMVGLSHVSLRSLIRRYLPQKAVTYWPTEMLNSRCLPKEALGKTAESFREEGELNLVPQILANEEYFIVESLKKLIEWGASGVDINMGCPVKKALRHNYGVALMGDISYAAKVVEIAAQSSMPVSVKLRAGFQSDLVYLKDFVQALEQNGAAWLCLHPRKAEQKRRGRCDWSQIKYVRNHVSVPVVGNGDIQVVDDIDRMFQETHCDFVMIGRALTARPWLFWQWGERHGLEPPKAFVGKEAPKTATEEAQEYGRSLFYLLESLETYFDEKQLVKRFLFHIKVSHVWLDFGQSLYARLTRCKHSSEYKEVIKGFFNNQNLRLMQRTELRY